jgi:hypothetical protein
MCCGCFTSSQNFGIYTGIFLTVKSMFTIAYASDFKLENENIIMHTVFMNINQISSHKIEIYFLEFFRGIQSTVARVAMPNMSISL